MFGLSKKKRAQKDIIAALNVILIGRKNDREAVVESSHKKMADLAAKVAEGTNPYIAAIDIVRTYILKTLDQCDKEKRLAYIKRISDHNLDKLPDVFALISHINYCVKILEDDEKPFVPPGTAGDFMETVGKWFASDAKTLPRVLQYFEHTTAHHRNHLLTLKKQNERRLRR